MENSGFGQETHSANNEHPLNSVDPRYIDLPGPNWGFFKPVETSLIIVEMMTPIGSVSPRPRKHVNVNLVTGDCTSYVLDRKISDVLALTKNDVERCVEELHMMHICVGGPPASKYPPVIRSNAHVDTMGNWRHNACKIVAQFTGLPCKACESIEYELAQIVRAMKQEKSSNNNGKNTKRVLIGHLSHRKQSQIIALRKRRHGWYRKRREAEKEMKLIEDMISEISEEPENPSDVDDDDDNDDE